MSPGDQGNSEGTPASKRLQNATPVHQRLEGLERFSNPRASLYKEPEAQRDTELVGDRAIASS